MTNTDPSPVESFAGSAFLWFGSGVAMLLMAIWGFFVPWKSSAIAAIMAVMGLVAWAVATAVARSGKRDTTAHWLFGVLTLLLLLAAAVFTLIGFMVNPPARNANDSIPLPAFSSTNAPYTVTVAPETTSAASTTTAVPTTTIAPTTTTAPPTTTTSATVTTSPKVRAPLPPVVPPAPPKIVTTTPKPPPPIAPPAPPAPPRQPVAPPAPPAPLPPPANGHPFT